MKYDHKNQPKSQEYNIFQRKYFALLFNAHK